MTYRLTAALAAALAGSCLLVGCSASTEVSLTGNTPAQYSHVWITTQELWFNSSATAGPDDSGWAKFPLSTATTIDLVAEGGGNLGSIISGLSVIPGTYSQIRVIPLDPSAALSTSASAAGALYNSEADYVDSSGTTQQLPLEFLNPDKGIGIATSLKVPIGNVGAALSSTSTTGSTTGTTTGTTTTGTTTATAGTVTGTPGTTTTTGTDTTTQTPNSFAIAEDGTRDLVPFTYAAGTAGIMLSSHAAAYDLTQSGGISGQLTLTNLTTSSGGVPAIQVSAQTLSADGTRHVVVSTTSVQSDGSFLLYPLATNSSNPAYYDVVIHGPGIATIIVKSVEVTLSNVTTTTPVAATTTTTTTTTDTTDTTAASTGTNTAVNPVSIGTLTPRAACSYTANLATSPAATLPAGAAIGFYQTLGTSGSVPYVIESAPIDPFNEVLFNAQGLSSGTVDSGTWSTSGGAINVISAAPAEGAGGYIVSPSAPSYADGPLTTKIPATTSTATTTTCPTAALVTVAAPALALPSGTASGTLHATVTQPAPAKYDSGELLVSYNGTLVASAPLGTAFTTGTASVTVSGLPADTAASLYYVSVRAWNSATPADVQRQWYPNAVDLRSSTSSSLALTLN
jgi:hypothetical protein